MKSYTPVMIKIAEKLGRSLSNIRKTKQFDYVMKFDFVDINVKYALN